MTNGKIIPVLSETSLKSVEKLEELGILVKEEHLSDDVRKVDLDTLFKLSVGGYRGGFEAAWIASLHTFVRTKNLLTDPYITIEFAGKKEPESNYPGCGIVHRKKDEKVEECPRCGPDGDMHHCAEHVWVRSGLYSYEVVRTMSTCYKCWWGNRIEIQNEEQARIDSGDMTGWGARV
jgi:hypothetical protein